jgi:hypothetical protein
MSYHNHGLGVVPDPYSVYNPPDYWTQMVNDPTQVPVQTYPYGSGVSPYGPYPGFYYGQRTMDYADAQRHARDRQRFMEHRAAVSSDPSHKYLTAEGRLDPRAAAALRRAKRDQLRKEDPVKKIQKRMVATVLIGAVLSALLK